MKREHLIFLVAGLLMGLISVLVGRALPAILTVGIGPLLFVGLIISIAVTRAWSLLTNELWRYVAAVAFATAAYVIALLVFSVVMGYSPVWLGIKQSGDVLEFHMDVLLGLLAGSIVAAAGISLVAAMLTGQWSSTLLRRLILAGIGTVLLTFTANLPFHDYWSFMGVLLPVGNALFCWLVGEQIWHDTVAELEPAL